MVYDEADTSRAHPKRTRSEVKTTMREACTRTGRRSTVNYERIDKLNLSARPNVVTRTTRRGKERTENNRCYRRCRPIYYYYYYYYTFVISAMRVNGKSEHLAPVRVHNTIQRYRFRLSGNIAAVGFYKIHMYKCCLVVIIVE